MEKVIEHFTEKTVIGFVLSLEVRNIFNRIRWSESKAREEYKSSKIKIEKNLKILRTQKLVIETKLEVNTGDRTEADLNIELMNSIRNYTNYLNERLELNPLATQKKAFLYFKNSSLFLTSLIIYAYSKRAENEAWLEALLDPKSDSEGISLKQMMYEHFKTLIASHCVGETESELLMSEVLKSKLIQNYPYGCNFAVYRGVLKRTLSLPGLIGFESDLTLDYIADLVIEPNLELLEQIADARYDDILLGKEKRASFQFMLSQNKEFLLLVETSASLLIGREIKRIKLPSK